MSTTNAKPAKKTGHAVPAAGTRVVTKNSLFLPKCDRERAGTVVGSTVCQFGDEWVIVRCDSGYLIQTLPELLTVRN